MSRPRRTNRYRHVAAAVYNTAWAITAEKLAAITDLLDLRSSGLRLTREEIRERIGETEQPPLVEVTAQHEQKVGALLHRREAVEEPQSIGRVAVINVFGVISQRMNGFEDISGGTSTEQLATAFRDQVADESIGAIVLNFDSPGGSVAGIPELSDLIYKSRGVKPITAMANRMTASAAYFLASAADEIIAVPSAEDIGSIGVLTVHRDDSKLYEQLGSKHTIIKSAEFKAEGNPYEELSEAARAHIQSQIDTHHDQFVQAVARNRGVTVAVVEERYGQGRSFAAAESLNRGLVDRIATLEEVLAEFGVGPLAGDSEQDNTSARQTAHGGRHRPAFSSASVAVEDDPRFQPVAELIGD